MSGTARGQGRAAAPRFAAECAVVTGGDLRHESALVNRSLVAQAGGTAVAPGPPAADAFGGVDIPHANAGAVCFGAVDTQPYEVFGFTMRAELDSAWPAAHIAWSYMVGSRGRIVTLGCTAGLTGSLTNQRTALPPALGFARGGWCPHGVQGHR